jgi:hypothetical protein
MDMRFGWYRSGSFTTVARELARCKYYLVGVQEIRRDQKSTDKSREL